MPSLKKKAQFKIGIWRKLIFSLLIFFYAFLLAHPIDLTTSDLGRHLINGREVLQRNRSVLFENYYSYTFPHQKFINHHWLSGVIFFLTENVMGSKALQIFHSGVLLTTFFVFFKLMKKLGSWQSASLLSLPAILFLGTRLEIRPESFGYLFLAISLWGCWEIIQNKKISNKWLGWFLFQQILWVNLHISFIFGWLVIGGLGVISLAIKSPTLPLKTLKKLGVLLVGMMLVSVLNPNGWDGLMVPLSIFQNYGYPVVENQTLWFLHRRISNPAISMYAIFAPLGTMSLLIFRKKINYFWQIMAWGGLGMGFLALRNIPLFVLFSFPFFSKATHLFLLKLKKNIELENPHQNFLIFFCILFVGLFAFVASGNFKKSISWKNRALGISQHQTESIEKIKDVLEKKNISGNIFSNYDLGSYLIYGFFPERKVFVDNRPEAYSIDFFQKKYIPMQESEKLWQEELKNNDFQAIIIGYRDITSWTQKFLKNRLQDSKWGNVYNDDRIVVLIKK